VSGKRFEINLLALMGVVLLVIAMFFPWWTFALEFNVPTDLYPYLIDGPGSELVGYKRSPMMTLLTGVLISCILLALIGVFAPKRLGRWLLIFSSLLNFLAAWRLLVRIAGVAALYHMPIQGTAVANYGGFAHVKVWSKIQPGLYLDVAGAILVLLGAITLWKIYLGRVITPTVLEEA